MKVKSLDMISVAFSDDILNNHTVPRPRAWAKIILDNMDLEDIERKIF